MKNKKNKYKYYPELLNFAMCFRQYSHNQNDYSRLCNPSYISKYVGIDIMNQISQKHILGDKTNYGLYIKESLNDKINRRGNVKRIKGLISKGKFSILKL